MQNEYPPLPSLQFIDNYPEQITQFAFQLTRKTSSNDLKKLSYQLKDLLISLKNALFISDDTEQINKYIHYFILLYKLIAYTRDIFVGKGERDLTYMMIYVWYTQFPILAIHILQQTAKSSLGCWKDIKYFCKYVRENSPEKHKDPIIETCVNILNQQLIKDLSKSESESKKTNVSKWIPREKSKKFGWLFDICAIQWSQIMYPEYYYFATTKPSISFQNKVKREYRKNISNLNRQLDTIQIKQCENRWSQIKMDTITENTKQKQLNVLLNQDIYGYIRRQTEDRNICRENMISYLFYSETRENEKTSEKKEIYSSFQMKDLIKEIEIAYTIEYMENINNNWDKVKGNILQNMENIIPILDLTTTNYINALSISIMLSEISKIQNKIIVYDLIPVWINLSETKSLLEKVTKIQEIKNSKQVETSNIFTALELLMLSIKNTNLSPEYVANLVLCIVSDFSTPTKELQLHIHYFFHKNGYPTPPHIIYWNVSSLYQNNYYPCNAFTPRTLMISGTSSSCFQFLNDPLWKEYTPYTYLCNVLGKERYHEFGKYFLELTLTTK